MLAVGQRPGQPDVPVEDAADGVGDGLVEIVALSLRVTLTALTIAADFPEFFISLASARFTSLEWPPPKLSIS